VPQSCRPNLWSDCPSWCSKATAHLARFSISRSHLSRHPLCF
jgi:hypothetical protein